MTASTTLRDVIGLPQELPRLGESTLIMIDFQNTYRTGVMRLDGAEEAVAARRAPARGRPCHAARPSCTS